MTELFGKLIIVGKDGGSELEFPLDKKSILIGRDHSCDIRIVNKEISRKHAEVYVEDSGAVFVSSMGREPVVVNGAPVTSPLELASGDKIEVLLEGRTRVFYFQGDDETVQIRAPAGAAAKAATPAGQRQPLGDANAAPLAAAVAAGGKPAKGPAPAPPPPPPPPPPAGALRGGPKSAPGAAPPPPAPPPPPKAAAPAPAAGGMPSALQEAIKAGVQLKKVGPAAENAKPAPAPEAGGRFVPNPADLMKLRAGLRKTAPAAEEPTQHAEQPAEAEKPAQVAEEAAPALAEEPATAAADEAAPMEDVDAEQAAAEPQPAAVEEPAAAAEPEPAADVAMPEAPTQPTPEPEVAVPAPAPAEEAAAADSALPKGRKSVRFHVDSAAAAGTPEGAARDATITIRLRKGDLEQIINVDDNTVAFAQWGFMGQGGAAASPLPDTVVSKRSRASLAAQLPPSAGKTPVPSALKELLAGSPAVSSGPQPTPGAGGPAAPAPTPATGARPAGGEGAGAAAPAEVVIDAATLAARLGALAAEHDVTLEVPADLFQRSPAASGLKVTLTPKSHQGPASAAKSVPRTAGRSRLAQAGTPAASQGGLPATQEVEEEAGAASARKSAGSAGRRRSMSRTPGTKIVIIEQGTQTTPGASARAASAAKRPAASQAGRPAGTPRLLSTIAQQTGGADLREGAEEEEEACSGEGPVGAASDDGSLEAPVEGAAAAAADTVPLKQYQRAVLKAKAYHAEARQAGGALRRMTAKAAKLKRAATALSEALAQERCKRQELQEAMQQVVLARAAQEAEAEAAADEAEAEMAADEAEEAEEQEQPAFQPRVVVLGRLAQVVSTAQRAGDVVVVRPSPPAGQAAPAPAPTPAREVVVLPASARKTPAPSALKRGRTPAPSAAKGRTPATAAKGATPAAALAAAAAAQGKTPAAKGTTPATAGVPQSLPRSMLKQAPGSAGAPQVVLDNVELPGWLFQGEQPPVPELAAAQEAVAQEAAQEVAAAAVEPAAAAGAAEQAAAPEQLAAADAAPEEQEQAAMEVDTASQPALAQVQAEAALDATASDAEAEAAAEADIEADIEAESEEEEAEEEEDFCHVCAKSEKGDILLLCDSCDNACHLGCSKPPLKRVPKGDWFCVECTAKQAQAAAEAKAAAKEAEEAEEEEEEADVCHVCEESHEGETLLLCDSCDNACHLGCCKPALKRVPKGDWFCVECTAKQAQAAKPAAKGRGGKRAAADEEEAAEPAKPAGRGRRGAAAAEPAAEEAPAAKGGRGRGAKRAAEAEPAESEQLSGRGKRGRAAAPKPSEEAPAPSRRGRAAASTATKAAAEDGGEVSTRRGRGAAKAEAPAPAARSARTRR